jgi:molybdate transport system ATP-binding protein
MAFAPGHEGEMKLELRDILVRLPEFNLELDLVLEHQAVAIVGPSGAGKTTLLDLVAGLRSSASAKITLDGEVFCDDAAGIFLPSRRRRLGYVPQDLALFPHLPVRRNLLYGRPSAPEDDSLFSFGHVCRALELEPLLDRPVSRLSGGEQQRAALGRALLCRPRLLLLDEPLASLDAALKSKIISCLQKIRDEFRVPMLYVSHQAGEAGALCDEVIVLERGTVRRRGSPGTLFQPG